MRLLTCLAGALLLTLSPALAQTAPQPRTRYEATEVTLRDVAAFVRVTTEDRRTVSVSVVNPGPLPAPRLRVSRNRLVIDGRLGRQIRSCQVDGAGFQVVTRRQGRLHSQQLPVIELRVPRDAVISAGGAVRLHLGPARSAEVRLDGCGDADVVRVEEAAEISVSGSSDVRLYEAGSAEISVAGAGDVTVGVVRSGLTVSIAGAGDLTVARADGPTNIAVQGGGDVLIREGQATTLSVVMAGAGDLTHNGSAERLDAVILGGGDVHVRRVTGEVTRRVFGGGEVTIGP